MTRKYKTSYKTQRNSKRFGVTFDAAVIAAKVQETCTICYGEIEESPMMRGVCYDCYRELVSDNPNDLQVEEVEKFLNLVEVCLTHDETIAVTKTRKSFAEYMQTDYIVEKEERAKGWREWKEAHPNSSPYRFS